MRRIPGHSGAKGNEVVDQYIKQTAKQPPLPNEPGGGQCVCLPQEEGIQEGSIAVEVVRRNERGGSGPSDYQGGVPDQV